MRTLAPMYRHQRIVETFESPQPGENLLLVNDHDPKPLSYQFHTERTGKFTWEYQEQGPKIWCVLIEKTQ